MLYAYIQHKHPMFMCSQAPKKCLCAVMFICGQPRFWDGLYAVVGESETVYMQSVMFICGPEYCLYAFGKVYF